MRQQPAKGMQHAGELRIQRRFDAQAFARQRMIEAQAVRVQQQAM